MRKCPSDAHMAARGERRLKSAAFFDLDGTLLRGLMIQAFPRYLADRGMIGEGFASGIDAIVAAYEGGAASYFTVAKKVPTLYATAIKGLSADAVRSMAKEFMEAYVPAKLLSYSKPLVRKTRQLVDLVIAVSGSPQEVVERIRGHLPFDEAYGSTFATRAGAYTGVVETNLILGESKGELIDALSSRSSIDPVKSIAFGDTDQDILVLRRVGLPVALNPNPPLLRICLRRGWDWYSEGQPPRLDALRIRHLRRQQ